MWTGGQWATCLLGLSLMTITITSLVIFLAFYKKHYEELSQRILNVLYAKLAVLSIANAIVSIITVIKSLPNPTKLTEEDKLLGQIMLYVRLYTYITFLELSICSLLRLTSSRLYMWVSLNIPHTAYNIIQAFVIVIIQYLIILDADVENADTPEELLSKLVPSAVSVALPILATVFILQMIILLR